MRTGRFTSDLLLGAKHLSRRERAELGDFFADVAEQRGFPLHTALLWNVSYFGYDLDRGGYLGSSPHISSAESGSPIPVGAFVDVPPPGTPIWGEVIYKEQRNAAVDLDGGGEIDARLSGLRAAIPRSDHAVDVSEALVIDYDAFGNDFHGYGAVEFARFVRKGWLDDNLHRVVVATYEPHEPTDDLSVFARYVLDTYPEELFAEFLAPGESLTAEDRRDLLLTSLGAVDEIAQGSDRLMSMGDYHLSRRAYAKARSASDDEILGGRLFGRMVRRVTDIPNRYRRCYTAVGAMVHDHARQDESGAAVALLKGTRYVKTVAHLNAAIAEGAGVRDDGIHLRLDDDGIYGGVWRAELLNGSVPAHARIDPLVPLGLGYAESNMSPAQGAATEPTRPLITVDEKFWTVRLRQIDIDYGDLPLPDGALGKLPDAPKILLDLGVEGSGSYRKLQVLDRERKMLRDINFADNIFPGVILRCGLVFGSKVVSARAHPLAVPQEIEGMTLTLEFDEAVFRRELRLSPLPSKVFRGSRTFVDRIATVFRQRGRPTEDGGWALRAEEVIYALFGSQFTPELAGSVLIALGSMDLDFVDGEHIWRPRLSRRTSAREHVRIRSARNTEGGRRLARRIQARLVGMHLRHYVSRKPSAEKQRTYAAALREHHAGLRLPADLPEDATWVKPFRVGSEGQAIGLAPGEVL